MTITNGTDTFEQGDLPVLFYDVADNLFHGSSLDYSLAGMPTNSPFYDPTLASVSSLYLDSLEDVLDPSSPDFDPNAYLFVTINPDPNLDTATDGFTNSGGSGAADAEFVADVSVPEPSTVAIAIAGLANLWLFRRGRGVPHRQNGSCRSDHWVVSRARRRSHRVATKAPSDGETLWPLSRGTAGPRANRARCQLRFSVLCSSVREDA